MTTKNTQWSITVHSTANEDTDSRVITLPEELA